MRVTAPRLVLLVVWAATVSLHGAAPMTASAQSDGQTEGIQLSPARLEQDVESDKVDITVSVRNNDPVSRLVEVRVVGLGHGLDGTPWILDDEPATHLQMDPVRVRLQPQEERELVVPGDLEGDGGGFYGAVTAEAVVDGDGASGVGVRTRVAGTLMLRGPRPWDETIEIEDIVLRPLEDGAYEVAAVVRDHGDVHVRPTGTLTVLRGDEILHTVAVDGSYHVLPGYARRLGGHWTPQAGLRGPLTIEAAFDGVETEQRSIAFPPPVTDVEEDPGPAAFDQGGGATLGARDDSSGEGSVVLWAAASGLIALMWTVLVLVVIGRRRRRAGMIIASALEVAALDLARSGSPPGGELVAAVEANALRLGLEARELAIVRAWPLTDLVTAADSLARAAASFRSGEVDLEAVGRVERWLRQRHPASPRFPVGAPPTAGHHDRVAAR